MNEFFAKNRLSSYIDGALSPRDNREMDLVILENLAVRTAHAEMVRAVELVGSEGRITPPEGLIDEIVSAHQDRPPSMSRMGIFIRLSLFVIVVCLGVGAYYYARGGGERVVDISAQRDRFIEELVDVSVSVSVAEPEAVTVPELVSGEATDPESEPEIQTVAPVVSLSPNTGPVSLAPSRPQEIGPQAELDLTSTNEWEEIFEGSGRGTVPSRYRFYAVNSGSLIQIASLARGAGGSLVSQNGVAFETFRMSTERNFSNFVARIPSESVASFLGELQLLGSLSVVPSDGVLLSPNGQVELGVQVQYSP